MFLFLKSQMKPCIFFRNAFQSTLLKHTGQFFLFCVMQTFYVQKCLGTLLRKRFAHKSFIQRANNSSWLISYFDVAYCYRLYGLSAFSNRHAVLQKF